MARAFFAAREGRRHAETELGGARKSIGFGDKDLLDHAARAPTTGPAGAPLENDERSNARGRYRGQLAQNETIARGDDLFVNRNGFFDFGRASGSFRLNEPRRNFSELGGWISSAITDESGEATVKVVLPHSTTEWAIVARGVTKDTYVGEGEGSLRTAMELQAALVAPRALTEGDRAELRLRAHNLTGEARRVDLELVTEIGDQKMAHTHQVEVPAHREGEASFPLQAASSRDVAIALAARSGDLEDRVEREIPVRPFGVEYRDGRAGHTSESTSFSLSLPRGREYTSLALSIEVGPDPGRDLVAAAAGYGYRPYNCRRIDVTNLSLASRGQSALRVLAYLEGVRRSTEVDASRLRGIASACLSRLLSAQRDDGAWSWIGDKAPDARTTSQAVLFLGLAKDHGLGQAEPALDKATEWLLAQVRSLRGDARIQAAHGLSAAGRGRFEVLNALHRGKAKLDLAGLARLALAWQLEQRPGLAAEVLTQMRPALRLGAAGRPLEGRGGGLGHNGIAGRCAFGPTGRERARMAEGPPPGRELGHPRGDRRGLVGAHFRGRNRSRGGLSRRGECGGERTRGGDRAPQHRARDDGGRRAGRDPVGGRQRREPLGAGARYRSLRRDPDRLRARFPR